MAASVAPPDDTGLDPSVDDAVRGFAQQVAAGLGGRVVMSMAPAADDAGFDEQAWLARLGTGTSGALVPAGLVELEAAMTALAIAKRLFEAELRSAWAGSDAGGGGRRVAGDVRLTDEAMLSDHGAPATALPSSDNASILGVRFDGQQVFWTGYCGMQTGWRSGFGGGATDELNVPLRVVFIVGDAPGVQVSEESVREFARQVAARLGVQVVWRGPCDRDPILEPGGAIDNPIMTIFLRGDGIEPSHRPPAGPEPVEAGRVNELSDLSGGGRRPDRTAVAM